MCLSVSVSLPVLSVCLLILSYLYRSLFSVHFVFLFFSLFRFLCVCQYLKVLALSCLFPCLCLCLKCVCRVVLLPKILPRSGGFFVCLSVFDCFCLSFRAAALNDLLPVSDCVSMCVGVLVYTLIGKFWGNRVKTHIHSMENALQRRIEPTTLHQAGWQAHHTTNELFRPPIAVLICNICLDVVVLVLVVLLLLLVHQMETSVSSMKVAVHCRSPRLL